MTSLEQAPLLGVPEAPAKPIYTQVTELEIQVARRAIIEADGDMEKAGITLETMANIIYTCRLRANPMAEAEAIAKAAKTPKAPKEAKVGDRVKLSGDDVDSFLG